MIPLQEVYGWFFPLWGIPMELVYLGVALGYGIGVAVGWWARGENDKRTWYRPYVVTEIDEDEE